MASVQSSELSRHPRTQKSYMLSSIIRVTHTPNALNSESGKRMVSLSSGHTYKPNTISVTFLVFALFCNDSLIQTLAQLT